MIEAKYILLCALGKNAFCTFLVGWVGRALKPLVFSRCNLKSVTRNKSQTSNCLQEIKLASGNISHSSVVLVHYFCVGFSLPSLGLNSYTQEHSNSRQTAEVCEGPEKPDPVRKNSLFTLNKECMFCVGIGNC